MQNGLRLDGVGVEEARRFHQVFVDAGYTAAATNPKTGMEIPAGDGSNLPRLLYLTSGGSRLDTLLRMFLLNVPVSVEQARYATAPIPLEEWCEAGLAGVAVDKARGLICVVPYGDLLLAADPPALLAKGTEKELVLGVTNSTFSMDSFLVRRAAQRTLDLGTGCGVFALLAADWSGEVIATDLNPRALQFARFNAAWNGKPNVAVRLGDTFEPVRGMQFDRIIANPPCIISPLGEYTFRDSGMELDGFCRKLAKEVPRYLAEGGLFQCTIQWANLKNFDSQERLSEWFGDSGCDALVLRLHTKSVLHHTEGTLADTGPGNIDDRIRQFGEMVRYLEEKSVESIGSGFVLMRRRQSAGRNWLRFEDIVTEELTPFGEDVVRALETEDYLRALRSAEDLLNSRPRTPGNLSIELLRRRTDAGAEEIRYHVRQVGGFQLRAEVDSRVVEMLQRCDGRRTLGETARELALSLGVDERQVAPGVARLAASLLQRGFLAIAG